MAVFSGNGAVGSPSFTFSADTDTGIFRPAANIFAISCGASETFSVNGSGNVGIGHPYSNVTTRLHVAVPNSDTPTTIARFQQYAAAGGDLQRIDFTNDPLQNQTIVTSTGSSNGNFSFRLSSTTEMMKLSGTSLGGQLFFGTPTNIADFNNGGAGWTAKAQTAIGSSFSNILQGFYNFSSSATLNAYGGATISVGRCKSGTVGTHTGGELSSGDPVGRIIFNASDGTQFRTTAFLQANVGGAVSTGITPGFISLFSTASGSGSAQENFRVSGDGVQFSRQAAPAAVNVTANLTTANLRARIITSTTAAGVTMTLPTGATLDTDIVGLFNSMALDWSVINTGPNPVTISGDTGHTVVGAGSVAAGTSASFRSRRSGANTWVTYQLS